MDDPYAQGNEKYRLDVEKVLKSKNPSLARLVPRFVIKYLKRIIHENELNDFLGRYGHLKGVDFIDAALNYLKISYTVSGRENIPMRGRFIFVSNHPLGGLDGLVFIYELSKYFDELKFPVNDILLNIKNFEGIFLPVNKHGIQSRWGVRAIEEAYASGCQILYFPAGLCSRKKKGVIKDLPWYRHFIKKAVEHKRDVVPAYFSGRNSEFFYNLANLRAFLGIKSNIEMLYLADEMFNQKDKRIHLVFGPKIPWETFDKTRTPDEWAEWVKSKTYELEPLTREEKKI